MPRLTAIDPNSATGDAKVLLEQVRAKFGVVPNMMRTMANSPAVLRAYLSFAQALETSSLGGRLGEKVALAVAQANACDYCLSAHSAIGKMVGLADEDIVSGRRGSSSDHKEDAALKLALAVVRGRGAVTDDDLDRARRSGLNDAESAEVIGLVALNVFTNYFNKALAVTLDFPAVPAKV